MNSELRIALYNRGSLVEGLNGGFWYIEAPQDVSYPYAVLSFVNNPFSRDSENKFEEYYIQINIYSKSGTEIETIKENVVSLFDDSESNYLLDSYYFERIERQFANARKLDDVYQISIQYKIELTKK